MSHSIQRIGWNTPPQRTFYNSFHLGKGSPPKRDTGSGPAHFLGPSHYQVKFQFREDTQSWENWTTNKFTKTKQNMIYSPFGILHGSMANYIDVILIYRLFLSIPPHIIFKKTNNKKTVAFPTETGQVPQIKNSWHFISVIASQLTYRRLFLIIADYYWLIDGSYSENKTQ